MVPRHSAVVRVRAVALFVVASFVAATVVRAALAAGLDLRPSQQDAPVTLDQLVADVARVGLLGALAMLALSVCLVALDVLTEGRSRRLHRWTRRSTPATWCARVVLSLCGLGLVAPAHGSDIASDDSDGRPDCRSQCSVRLEGLPMPDLPTLTAPTAPTARTNEPNPTLQSVPSRRLEAEGVTVRRGDCLWDIAARELGDDASASEIAHRADAWHAHNRKVIGPDPDLIFPNTQLTPPPPEVPQ